ncbi:C-terminal binding protein [Lysinibacter sp. HNR]|uniref:C-terminal binding protein n=1 Tax=Lysinibacter sp. HNR TaxID=3031408 RepID=UPI0024354E90|nr:C-terminal binding protein [Lysinibacter sp. HNR]WGD37668.1 C-terminal binding protein [Lysinibacter sp. HNR]
MNSRPLVVFTDQTDLDPEPGRALLHEAGFDTVLLNLGTDERHDDRIVPQNAREAVGLVVGYALIDRDILEQFPRLRIIATSSSGVDTVDMAAAQERGIWVSNLADVATEEVASHALSLVLAVERQLSTSIRVAFGGGWTQDFDALPRRLSKLTLGLFGCGKIARRLAEIAVPLFGRIIAYDPYLTNFPTGVTAVTRQELLKGADVLSLHVPLTKETREVIDHGAFALMKSGSSLVNVSRGELIDREALTTALNSGRIAGVGLDVLDGEPPSPNHPLRSHPRAIVTPHVGFLSDGSLQHYLCDPSRMIVEWWQTGRPSVYVVAGSGD